MYMYMYIIWQAESFAGHSSEHIIIILMVWPKTQWTLSTCSRACMFSTNLLNVRLQRLFINGH